MNAPLRPAAFGARLGALAYGAGALGLIAVCVFYLLAGPEAALPGGASAGMGPAITATSAAAVWMRLAGLLGMPSDVLLAVGALMFAFHANRDGASSALAGWLAIAIASTLFILVDAIVSMVLPPAAALDGGAPAYAAVRTLFDVLFSMGTWTAGAGALATAWRSDGVLFRWPAVGWGMRLAGAVCLLSPMLHVMGGVGAAFLGPGIALLAIASLGVAAAHVVSADELSARAQKALPSS